MDFKKATDELFQAISHDDLAKALGMSVASIRQARLGDGAKARRSPPPGWEKAVLRLAAMRVRHLDRLTSQLRRRDTGSKSTENADNSGVFSGRPHRNA